MGQVRYTEFQTLPTAARTMRHFGYKSPPQSFGLNLTRINTLPVGHAFVSMIDELIYSAQSGTLEAGAKGRAAGLPITGLPSEGHWEITVRVRSPQPWAEVIIACDNMLDGLIYGKPHTDTTPGSLQREMIVTQDTIIGIGRVLGDD